MTEPAIEPDQVISPRRWFWWAIAFLAVALLAAGGVAGWSRQGATTSPPASTPVAEMRRGFRSLLRRLN